MQYEIEARHEHTHTHASLGRGSWDKVTWQLGWTPDPWAWEGDPSQTPANPPAPGVCGRYRGGGLSECIGAPRECHRETPLDGDRQLPQNQQGEAEGPLAPSLGQSAGSRARVWAKARPPLGPSLEVGLSRVRVWALHRRLRVWREGSVGMARTPTAPREGMQVPPAAPPGRASSWLSTHRLALSIQNI